MLAITAIRNTLRSRPAQKQHYFSVLQTLCTKASLYDAIANNDQLNSARVAALDNKYLDIFTKCYPNKYMYNFGLNSRNLVWYRILTTFFNNFERLLNYIILIKFDEILLLVYMVYLSLNRVGYTNRIR